MISLWALLSEADVESYAGSLVLPSYLSHLRLGPFRFSGQSPNADGQEPLKLTYCGEGRLEEFSLPPEDHVLDMIRFACPRIRTSRIRLPRDDARWYWNPSADPPEPMRIYFEPTTRSLYGSTPRPAPESYVSVSRRQVFIGRAVVEAYLRAWFESLGIEEETIEFQFDTPSAGVEFAASGVGGQMFLSDEVMARELIRFAGLERPLSHVSDWVELDLNSAAQNEGGVHADGVYIQLSKRVE
ncbi:MAG: hypothetical protein A2V98_18785 [Planctomycetes bacterium RBG_16_64_12]|nr:MAG: hypothetical protein A2V98_18785 [Planctomycetes bacterium RBG_16_64_12]